MTVQNVDDDYKMGKTFTIICVVWIIGVIISIVTNIALFSITPNLIMLSLIGSFMILISLFLLIRAEKMGLVLFVLGQFWLGAIGGKFASNSDVLISKCIISVVVMILLLVKLKHNDHTLFEILFMGATKEEKVEKKNVIEEKKLEEPQPISNITPNTLVSDNICEPVKKNKTQKRKWKKYIIAAIVSIGIISCIVYAVNYYQKEKRRRNEVPTWCYYQEFPGDSDYSKIQSFHCDKDCKFVNPNWPLYREETQFMHYEYACPYCFSNEQLNKMRLH